MKVTEQCLEFDSLYKKSVVLQRPPATITLKFNFSEDWRSLQKSIVFMAENEPAEEIFFSGNSYPVPIKKIASPGIWFYICGTKGTDYRKPTNRFFIKILSEEN